MMDAPGKERLDSAVACSGVSEKAIRVNLIRRTTKPTTAYARHPDGHVPLQQWHGGHGAAFFECPALVHLPPLDLHHRSDFSTNSQVPKGKKY